MRSIMATRSSLELMLDAIRQRDEESMDAPPVLPLRPVLKGRLPTKRRLLDNTGVGDLNNQDVEEKENMRICEGTEGFECNNDGGAALEKIGKFNETGELTPEGALRIQKCFRGHQARCDYQKLKEGVIMLQSLARGCLTRKQLTCIDNQETVRKLPRRFQDTKDLVHVPSSVLMDLQSQITRVEERLEKKEEENTILQQQLLQSEEENAILKHRLQQSEKRWSEYETKMKAMEDLWQTQLTSLQMSLGAAKRGLDAGDIMDHTGRPNASPFHHYHNFDNTSPMHMENHKFSFPTPDGGTTQRSNRSPSAVCHLVKEFEQQQKAFDDDSSFLFNVKPGQPGHEDELRKLKLRYEAWKKDYKVRLHEAKVMLQKMGNSETERSRRKWWGKMSTKGIWDFELFRS